MVPTRASTIYCAFLFLAGVANAEKKTFNVISFGKDVRVSVNGGWPVRMSQRFTNQPLYSVELNVTGPVKYRYLERDDREEFVRDFPTGASATFNDFFGRKDTIKHFPKLPLPFKGEKNGQWTRGMGQVNPYNETYIPTIHFTGKKVKKWFKSPEDRKRNTFSVFFINRNEEKLLKNVTLSAWSTRNSKFNIRMTLGGGDEYYGRNVFKFRFGENDPTFLREKLYTDMLVAVGAPVHQTNVVRVYVNGRAIGLYLLQDETSDENFIRTEFYEGNARSKMGTPIEGHIGSDFQYTNRIWEKYRNQKPFSAFRAHAASPDHHNYREDASNKRVIELCKAVHDLDPNNKEAVAEFDRKWFDLDTFFKAIAFEYALGHWDSYWGLTSNFALYDDPSESNKFYFLDEDFEHTFGAMLSSNFNQYGRDFTKQSYKTLVNRDWTVPNKEGRPSRRTMVDKLLSSPALTERFETILKTIGAHLLNPEGLFPRIDAMWARYREEIRWDRTIQRVRLPTRNDYNWTLTDYDQGIKGYPNEGSGPNGIKWALKQFIRERSDALKKEFKLY